MVIDNRIVAENISGLRIRSGMTQQQLAGALNVSHQAVSKWENGAAIPDIQTLAEISRMFGVSIEQLICTKLTIEEPPLDAEAESNEPESFGKWIRDTLPDGTMDALRSAAAAAKKSVAEFGQKAGKTMSGFGKGAEEAFSDLSDKAEEMFVRLRKSSTEIDEAAETDENCEKGDSEEAPDVEKAPEIDAKTNFENILSMAPFMSREKLNELVNRMTGIDDWEKVLKIAPYLGRATIQKLTERMADCPADSRVLKRIAPYAGPDNLYKLILGDLSQIDWETLRALAPFLHRSMVDALTDYLITGALPAENVKAEKKKDGFTGAIHTAMNEIENAVSEIGKAVGGIFRKSEEEVPEETEETQQEEEAQTESACETEENKEEPRAEEENAPAPAEMKNRIAKAALVSGNWMWINTHLFEIGDTELLTEIAVRAVRDFAAEDNGAIAVRAAAVLNKEQLSRLFDAVIDERAWGIAIALKNLVGEEAADRIIEEAAKSEGAERENAYLAIENFASAASKETLEKVTEKAIASENWVLINALTDAF